MSLVDKSLTPDEEGLLASVRQKLKISNEDHRQILKECGWTPEEFEGIRKEDPWRRECWSVEREGQRR
jgi:DNA-directed RNA polymerase subunit H (RpoH/RPB5)